MKEVYVKKYWEEGDILFYIYFQNNKAIKQIEVLPTGPVYLTLERAVTGDSMLYDQSLDELDLNESDFIAKEEFESVWLGKQ
jgi:hypothetical protein